MHHKKKLCAGFLLLMTAMLSHAVTIGELQLQSKFGEPLLAIIPLSDVGHLSSEEIKISKASSDIYRQLNIENLNTFNPLRFELTGSGNNLAIQVVSPKPIKEPFLEFVIELKWPAGQLYKSFNILLDPPN